MTVHFVEVGRDRRSWSAEVPDLSDSTLARAIHREGALMSRGIDFWWNDPGDEARIVVGDVRTVGRLRVDGGVKI